ncbi:MAG: DUF488 family protein [Firmicutes bacterium]|jgi:uncharacterized protein YeaO (DUF488 family)|nr:DUF488 family protein [Bacillota bacterium]
MQALMIGRVGAAVDTSAYRVLVDRLWPRGVSKTDALWDIWLKEVAPSTDLRKWYGHERTRYTEFRQRYFLELEQRYQEPAMQQLLNIWRKGPVILLTATKSLEFSQAPILRDFLLQAVNAHA